MPLIKIVSFSRVKWFRSLKEGDKVLLKIRPDNKMRKERGIGIKENRDVIVTITDIEGIEAGVDHILAWYPFGIIDNFYGRYELVPLGRSHAGATGDRI